MRRLTPILAGISVLLAWPAMVAEAQSSVSLTVPLASIAQQEGSIESHWAIAEQLQGSGDLRGGLEEFEAIARAQREMRLNAAATYWRLAEIRNALGRPLAAADALDTAAREAARFGDRDLQAKALLEAAVLYSHASRPARARDRLARLNGLIESASLTPDTRESLLARIPGR